MTNGDTIRAMTDEELAQYFADTFVGILSGMPLAPIRDALLELYKSEVRE